MARFTFAASHRTTKQVLDRFLDWIQKTNEYVTVILQINKRSSSPYLDIFLSLSIIIFTIYSIKYLHNLINQQEFDISSNSTMKGSLISLVVTALMVTLFFQPHQHISAASQNNGCLGLHCLTAVDDETNFMDQLVAGGDTSFLSQSTMSRGRASFQYFMHSSWVSSGQIDSL